MLVEAHSQPLQWLAGPICFIVYAINIHTCQAMLDQSWLRIVASFHKHQSLAAVVRQYQAALALCFSESVVDEQLILSWCQTRL